MAAKARKYSYFVQENAAAPGTGKTVTLAGSLPGSLTFSSQYSDGDPIFYGITDAATGALVEVGYGSYQGGSNNTITRDTPLMTTSGNTTPLNFSGPVIVYSTMLPSYLPVTYSDGSVAFQGTVGYVDSGGNSIWSITPAGDAILDSVTMPKMLLRSDGSLIITGGTTATPITYSFTVAGDIIANSLSNPSSNFGISAAGAASFSSLSVGGSIARTVANTFMKVIGLADFNTHTLYAGTSTSSGDLAGSAGPFTVQGFCSVSVGGSFDGQSYQDPNNGLIVRALMQVQLVRSSDSAVVGYAKSDITYNGGACNWALSCVAPTNAGDVITVNVYCKMFYQPSGGAYMRCYYMSGVFMSV